VKSISRDNPASLWIRIRAAAYVLVLAFGVGHIASPEQVSAQGCSGWECEGGDTCEFAGTLVWCDMQPTGCKTRGCAS
jgi:hypothetical protein